MTHLGVFLRGRKRMEPLRGLEPRTYALSVFALHAQGFAGQASALLYRRAFANHKG